ncbi:hypothetical protein ACNO6Y_09230 [Vibrio owensii]|uniref:hypothetical protein n=1 Tax=Vibrio owensii TaxID=696485 RepID=UPI003AAF3C71
MSSIFKAIALAACMAFLLIILHLQQYLVYGYGLIVLATLSVLMFSWLERKASEQQRTERQSADKICQHAYQQTLIDAQSGIVMLMREQSQQREITNQQLTRILALVEQHTHQVSTMFDSKLTQLSETIHTTFEQQSETSYERQGQLAEQYIHLAENLSERLKEENQRGEALQAQQLQQLSERLGPLADLSKQIEKQTQEHGEFIQAYGTLIQDGNTQLQQHLSEHSKQFTQSVGRQLGTLNDDLEDRLNDFADHSNRMLEDLRQVLKTAQNGQSRMIEEMVLEINSMAESQLATQSATAQTLQALIEFKEELTALNQRDLQHLEALLNG